MKLPREYKRFIGNYAACRNAYGRKMLRKFGFGPETEAVAEVKPKKYPKRKTTK